MPKPDSLLIVRIFPKNKLANIVPKEGLEMTHDAWDVIETKSKYKSNFDRRSENWVFVQNLEGEGSKEFRATPQKGWYRVQAGITINEGPSRELLSWLNSLGLLKVEAVDRTHPLITRQITAEERRVCLGSGVGRPLSRDHAWRLLSDPAMRRILKRRPDP